MLPEYKGIKLGDNSTRALNKLEYLIIFFLFLVKIICCDPSSEPFSQDGSDEGSQHIFFT